MLSDTISWLFSLPPVITYSIIGVVVVGIFLLWKMIFRDEELAPRTYWPEEQAKVDRLHHFKALKDAEDFGKKVFGERFKNRMIMNPGYVGIAILLLAVMFVMFQGIRGYVSETFEDYMPEQTEETFYSGPELVGSIYINPDTGEQYTVFVATEEPTQEVFVPVDIVTNTPQPALTLAPVIVSTMTAQPTATQLAEKFVVKPVKLSGNMTDWDFTEISSLGSYIKVSEAKCGFDDIVFTVPQASQDAFIYFEGGRDNFLVAPSLANVTDDKVEIVGNEIHFKFCRSGGWYSLWVN